MLEACGPGGIPGDPRALRDAADALEGSAALAEGALEDIRSAVATILAGWSAPSAEGFEALSAQQLSCAAGLIRARRGAARILRTYAEELEAAQRAFAGAREDAEAAGREFDAAESDSREEHRAESDLDDARGGMRAAAAAALAANEHAAREIRALEDVLAKVPPTPHVPAPGTSLHGDEPPPEWPGWAQSWFKIGRGEAAVIEGLGTLAREAYDHPDQIPGAVYGFGESVVTDPVGAGKAFIGYDELAAGRYEDWIGQTGIGVFLGGVGGRAGSAARLTRVRGGPRIAPLGRRPTPINGRQFAGRRVDFSRADLGARPGTTVPKLDAAKRAELARRFPNGVRFTRAGYPVFTPYAIERVRVPGLTGVYRPDADAANARAGLRSTPKGYTWHHAEDGRTMELVPTALNRIPHTGGAAAIKADQLGEVAPGGSFTRPERALSGAGASGGLAGGPAAAPPPGSGR